MVKDVSCGSVIYDLCYVELVSLYAHFLESFYHIWLLNSVKSFSCLYEVDHIVFILQFSACSRLIILICQY